jgi:DNA-binding response OmpR family regulator
MTKMRILVIDDDAAVRYTLSRILTRAGHEVAVASDGEHGAAIFIADEPDLVITDLIMPRQDGIETIAQIRRHSPGVKIIAISGGNRTMNIDGLAEALERGADDVIIKPFEPDDLLNRVSQFATRGSSGRG